MTQPAKIGFKSRIWILLLLPILVLGCSIVTSINRQRDAGPIEKSVINMALPTPTQLDIPSDVTEEEMVLVNLYARSNPAVVGIFVYGQVYPITDGQNGGQIVPIGQGSGFVYDTTGNIITNAHVVNGAEQLEVVFFDGTTLNADIVGKDLNSDLAVIKVDQLPIGIGPLAMGNMAELAVGQTVVAIGNPFGLDGTLTRGIISALGRTIPALTPFSIPHAIQTDAAINPGNSGGPLLDLHGHVIGVNAQIETDGTSRSNSGVGFAIPVDVVERVVPILIEKGGYDWPWLGVRGRNLVPVLVDAMNLPVERGAYILEVTTRGPAEKAGVRGANESKTINGSVIPVGGDVVTAIDGQPINSFDDLLIYIAMQTSPGQKVNLTVLRDGETLEISVLLEKRPDTLRAESPANVP